MCLHFTLTLLLGVWKMSSNGSEGLSSFQPKLFIPQSPQTENNTADQVSEDAIKQIASQNLMGDERDRLNPLPFNLTVVSSRDSINKLLQLPDNEYDNTLDSIIKSINDNSPDLSKRTPDGKNILHLAVNEDLKLLTTILNHPNFNPELVHQKDHLGRTPLDLIDKLQVSEDIKFQKKYMLILSGFGAKLPEKLDLGQFFLNKKILNRLRLKDRTIEFFDHSGLCNAYSFLYNFYKETKGEEYFYTSLLLMGLWDGTKEMLEKPIPSVFPQSAYYHNLDELFEQWTNDLFFSFASTQVENVIPTMEQHLRSFQYDFLEPLQSEVPIRPTTIYFHERFQLDKSFYSSLCDCHIKRFDELNDLEEKRLIAEAKSRFIPTFFYLVNRNDPSIKRPLKFYDLNGNEKSIDLNLLSTQQESGDSTIQSLDPEDFRFVVNYLRSMDAIEGEKLKIPLVTKERMLELVKYLSRLPDGLYVDVFKTQHCTTFQQLPNGKLGYYDCNDHTPQPEILDYVALNDVILKAHGHTDNTALLEKYPSLHAAIEGPNSFIPHAYYLNSPRTQLQFEKFSVFTEEEFPRNKEEAIAFYQESANNFTHLHIATVTHDLNSIQRILEDGFVDLDAKDCYDRTALEIAIKNGFIDAALIMLDKSPSPYHDLNSDCLEQEFKIGNQENIEKLISHPKLKVNYAKAASAAMRWKRYDVVEYLLTEKKIDPNTFIQGSVLAQDFQLIDLLIRFGANVNTVDNLGNTAFHYAMYQLNSPVCAYLLNNFSIDLKGKNHQDESPLDILQMQVNYRYLLETDKIKAQAILSLISNQNSNTLPS